MGIHQEQCCYINPSSLRNIMTTYKSSSKDGIWEEINSRSICSPQLRFLCCSPGSSSMGVKPVSWKKFLFMSFIRHSCYVFFPSMSMITVLFYPMRTGTATMHHAGIFTANGKTGGGMTRVSGPLAMMGVSEPLAMTRRWEFKNRLQWWKCPNHSLLLRSKIVKKTASMFVLPGWQVDCYCCMADPKNPGTKSMEDCMKECPPSSRNVIALEIVLMVSEQRSH